MENMTHVRFTVARANGLNWNGTETRYTFVFSTDWAMTFDAKDNDVAGYLRRAFPSPEFSVTANFQDQTYTSVEVEEDPEEVKRLNAIHMSKAGVL